jgi:hypothetical protein
VPIRYMAQLPVVLIKSVLPTGAKKLQGNADDVTSCVAVPPPAGTYEANAPARPQT